MDSLSRLASFNWVAITSTVVPIVSMIVTLTRTPASRRRLNALLEMRERVPQDLQCDLTDAIGVHLGYYLAEMEHRATRKLNKSMIAVEIVVAPLGGGAMSLFDWLGGAIHWAFWGAFGVSAVVMFILLAAGAAQLYAYPTRDEELQSRPSGGAS